VALLARHVSSFACVARQRAEAFLSETGLRFDPVAARRSEDDLDTVARLIQRLAQDRADAPWNGEG